MSESFVVPARFCGPPTSGKGVMAWPRGREGRKYYSGTCLYSADGHLLACANAVWISVDPRKVRAR